ncbi:MAG: T9SS type A sorting domain-containing protein [Saprospiraceae bacterium]
MPAIGGALINAGDDQYNFHGTDVRSCDRVDAIIDLGGYERQSLCNTVSRLYVDETATGNNDGTSWVGAFTDLQAALNCADAGDAIWVAEGTYYPSQDYRFNYSLNIELVDRDHTFYIKPAVSLYGGFAGTETALDQRDLSQYRSVLSGDIGNPNDDSDNCYHVVTSIAESTVDQNGVTIDGFTITGGNANGQSEFLYFRTRDQGGALFLVWGFNTVRNCEIYDNKSNGNGAGLCLISSGDNLVTKNGFHDNISLGTGGGYFSSSNLDGSNSNTLTDNVFYNNTASQGGGAALFDGGVHTVHNNTFYANQSSTGGGGCLLDNLSQSSVSALTNNIFGTIQKMAVPPQSGADYVDGTSAASISYCLVQPNNPHLSNSGMITANPLFLNTNNPSVPDGVLGTADDGLGLLASSPASNAGTNNTYMGYLAPLSCSASSTLPTDAGLYTSTYSVTDDNDWRHFCTQNGELLLSINAAGVTMDMADNAISLNISNPTAEYFTSGTGFISNPDGAVVFNRTWDAQPDVQPDGEVAVRYYFTAAEYQAVNTALSNQSQTPLTSPAQLWMYKHSASPHADIADISTATVLTNAAVASTSNWSLGNKGIDYYAEYDVSSFSGGGGGGTSGGASVLPVELLYFNAKAQAKEVLLNWRTANEQNNRGFTVERSTDGRHFEAIGWVSGYGTSQEEQAYAFVDKHPVQGINYYRLQQEDYDGTSTSTEIVRVNMSDQNSFTLSPNPIADGQTVKITLSEAMSQTQVSVYNLLGHKVLQVDLSDGQQQATFSTAELAKGVYLVVAKNGSQSMVERLIVE